jgi:hypothetical protein
MATKGTAKKEIPYIDYKTADVMARMFDFINNASKVKKSIYNELERMIGTMRSLQKDLTPISDDPNNWASALDYDHFKDDIANIRHDAREMGLTQTLFEKLKNEEFRDRFTGWLQPPVLKEEIEDHFEEEPEKAENEEKAVNA